MTVFFRNFFEILSPILYSLFNSYSFLNHLTTFGIMAWRCMASIFNDGLANAGSILGGRQLLLFLLSLFLLESLLFLSL